MLSSWGDGSGCFSLFSFSLSSLALASASGLTSSSTSSTLRSWPWLSFPSQVCSGCLRWGGCVQRWLRKHQQHLPPTGIIGTTLFANLLDPSLDWSFHAIDNNSRTMRWVRIIKNRNIKLILIVKTQFLIQWPFHVYRSFLKYTYGSDSAGRGKCLFYVFFSKKVEPPCDQTWLFRIDFSIDTGQIWVLDPGKIFGRPWKFFLGTLPWSSFYHICQFLS